MLFDQFLNKIASIQEYELEPEKPFLEMTPPDRRSLDLSKIDYSKAKKAAVLALFYPNSKNETCILLTLRASYKGSHSNQISFPGGKKEPSDSNSEETALRETFEEVGLNNLTIIKNLSKLYIPPSNFYVSPFMAYIENTPKFNSNHEVREIIEFPVSKLLDEGIVYKNVQINNTSKTGVPCFKLKDYIIWGATAMMLNEIKYLIKFLK